MRMTNFAGKTVGLMVASGFDEATFIAIQKATLAAKAKLKIISRDAGLTNAWNSGGWGMSYPVDSTLSTTLAVDYDALIIPQGERHIENCQPRFTPSGSCGLFSRKHARAHPCRCDQDSRHCRYGLP